ncbi:hypothetical protein FKM82_013400 [Ascaphus truei]
MLLGVTNTMADGGHEENRQHPQNLQGLLHMAIEAGTESGTPNQTEQMSVEVQQDPHLAFSVGEIGSVLPYLG